MLVHVPGQTDGGIPVSVHTEFVDLFPTLAELAAGVTMEKCPQSPKDSGKVGLCTEGHSLAPLISNPEQELISSAFSQYPRGFNQAVPTTFFHEDDPRSTPSPSNCISGSMKCTMGYSMRTSYGGKTWRFTKWIHLIDMVPQWNQIQGIELYNHDADAAENFNLANDAAHADIVAALSKTLQEGWYNA